MGKPPRATQLFAANVDTRESNLDRYDPALLPRQFHRDLQASQSGPPQLPTTKPPELFRTALAVMLLLLFVETLLAWLFASDVYLNLRARVFGLPQ